MMLEVVVLVVLVVLVLDVTCAAARRPQRAHGWL
jgi:hypothetical protein